MGCNYVKDFDFPASQGFSGSAGKTIVKGYARGGSVSNPNRGSAEAADVAMARMSRAELAKKEASVSRQPAVPSGARKVRTGLYGDR